MHFKHHWSAPLSRWKAASEERRQEILNALEADGYTVFAFSDRVEPVRKEPDGKPISTHSGKTLLKGDTFEVRDWLATSPNDRASITYDLARRGLFLERIHDQPFWPGNGRMMVSETYGTPSRWDSGDAPFDLVPDPTQIDDGQRFIATVAARDEAEAFMLAERVFRQVGAKLMPIENENAYRSGYVDGFTAVLRALADESISLGDVYIHSFRALREWREASHRGEHSPPPAIMPVEHPAG